MPIRRDGVEKRVHWAITVDHYISPLTGENQRHGLAQGEALFVSGWSADLETGMTPPGIYALIDDTIRVDARFHDRHDVAHHFQRPELAHCGFSLSFLTDGLALGEHRFTLLIEDGQGGGDVAATASFILLPPPTESPVPRVIVVAAPKSGSRFAELVLQKYFDTEEMPPFVGDGPQVLDDWIASRLRARAFVLHMHAWPEPKSVAMYAQERITPIVTWRNLADVVVSLHDHLRKNTPWICDDPEFFALSDQESFRYIIRYHLYWSIEFYRGWKKAGAHFYRYEDMVADQEAFFATMIESIAGSVDRDRLAAVLRGTRDESVDRTNINVGRIGRSMERFDDGTKRMLEAMLEDHFDNLEELIAELPWRAERR
jgi:hypothetical protein